MNDADSFALDERVLKLGMIWQWKAQKGVALRRGHGHLWRRADDGDGPRQPGADHHRPPADLGQCRRLAYPWPVPP